MGNNYHVTCIHTESEKYMKQKGFTLAEVLITLAIIGVVAALTIPSVISNYQQMEFKTGLKKAVSVLNEAIQTNIAQDGETPYDNSNLFNYLQRHMSVIKTAQSPEYGSNFVFYTTDGFRFEQIGIHGAPPELYFHETGESIFAHKSKNTWHCPDYAGGACWFQDIHNPDGWCGSYGLLNNPNKTITAPCVIIVDVNGDKKPNPNVEIEHFENGEVSGIAAKYKYPSPTDKKLSDIFTIMITDEKAVPFGVVAQRAMYSK